MNGAARRKVFMLTIGCLGLGVVSTWLLMELVFALFAMG